jgi:ABC-type polysaccharide/polyol phosphate export permease
MRCFLEIIRKEIYLFFKEFISRFIDISIILATNVIVFGYLMAGVGIKVNYGSIILVGAIASFGLFETIGKATYLAQDVTDKKISNFLILPISSSYVFIAIAISWAICTSMLSLCLFPIGKLILWNNLDLSNFSFFKFILIFSTGNLFYGFFSLWISSLVMNLRNVSWLWCRIINPLFMFCGYYYSWRAVYNLSHLIAYFHFVNPLLYILEATKASVLGQGEYLPFWICCCMLWLFIGIFAFDAVRRFRKRLDFI